MFDGLSGWPKAAVLCAFFLCLGMCGVCGGGPCVRQTASYYGSPPPMN